MKDWNGSTGLLSERVVVLLSVSVVLFVSAGLAAGAVTGSGGRLSSTSPAGSTTGPDYTVAFVETGLPEGTDWSITMAGTMEHGTGSTLSFSEPNGTYPYFPGPVSGYTSYPEANVTVTGAAVNVSVSYTLNSSTSPSCSSFVWSGDSYFFSGNCRGLFDTDYRAYNASTGYSFANSSFDVGAIAEVAPSGVLQALAVPGYQGFGEVNLTESSTGVNATDVMVGNVTTAIGLNANSGEPNGQTPLWTPGDASGWNGSTIWGNGARVLGRTTITAVFHFNTEGGGASNRVEFDVSVSGWPWVNASDQLGLEIVASAEVGTYFVYSAAADTITEEWVANGSAAASLVFGPTANATGPGTSTLAVGDQVGLYPAGSQPDLAYALLAFEGAGGYSNLTYDPWIVFGPAAGLLGPIPGPTSGATLPLLAVGIIAAVAVALGFVSYRARRRPADEGLASVAPATEPSPQVLRAGLL